MLTNSQAALNAAKSLPVSPVEDLHIAVTAVCGLAADIGHLADSLAGSVPEDVEPVATMNSSGGLFGAIGREADTLQAAVRRAERAVARVRSLMPPVPAD